MVDGPITDSASLYQRIRRWHREIVAAAIITIAAAAFLGATNWRMNAARMAETPAEAGIKLADHPAN